MLLINLTPHDVVIMDWENDFVIPASGEVARVSSMTETVGTVNGIRVTSTKFGDVQGLPDPVDGICYVVSAMVAQRVPERTDVYYPAGAIRDEKGIIVGCKSLGKVW